MFLAACRPWLNPGTPFSFTVTAGDGSGAPLASYSGTVHFTSSDTRAVLPANTTLTNGTGVFTVALNTAGNQTITVNDVVNTNIAATSSPITVGANVASSFVVTSLTPTPTGFVATFNEPIYMGDIDLYDTASALLPMMCC